MSEPPLDDSAIFERLRLLDDPEIGLNIVDLGMVSSIEHDTAGNVRVVITPTSPNCPMHDQIVEGARLMVESIPGVKTADITMSFDPPWTPDLITPAGREFLENRS
ncbi:MAG: metal-sulfur cluster assembly factor [Verrucomicrobia bacterium]|nr:metal-sulfur cluster assembly factor [Verrucomicrobiota bacterium]